jgi:hypothetical protein
MRFFNAIVVLMLGLVSSVFAADDDLEKITDKVYFDIEIGGVLA